MYRRLLLILLASGSLSAGADTSLCDHVTLKEGKIKLTKNEKVLICGSDKSEDGWREVPLPQAEYQLNVLLQNFGYLQARFERDGDRLNVWTGPIKKTESLEVSGAPGLLRPSKKRKIVGYPLEPSKLDEVKDWANLGLRRQGYACPEVKIAGQAWDAKIAVAVVTGPKQHVASEETSGLEGLDASVLSRYQAFHVGDDYDVIETQLTTGRMLDQALFQSAYFTTHCQGDQVDLHLYSAVGKPRVFRFGIGASTEEFPFVDIWFKNTRLDDKASNFTVPIYASNRRQSLNVDSELYWLSFSKRTFLGPRFVVKRQSETDLEDVQVKTGIDLGRSFDRWKNRFDVRTGPTLNFVNTVRGVGPQNVRYLSWQGSVATMSHAYEVFSRDQFEGWTAGFQYAGQRRGLGSPINVDRYELDFKHLWNLGAFSPPLFVLGTRFEGIGVNFSQTDLSDNTGLLPSDYRIFYGGDENLRGFGRRVLDNNQLGYLTALHAGFELRLVEVLPYKLEPFLLWDAARLGRGRMTLDPPLYTSSGFGLRWASPFGTLRGSVAHGDIAHGTVSTNGYPREWVYFVSFGQEF